MSLLTGLHGTAALLLLCTLLFLEEAGVPMPILPGDGVLIAGGLFVARGSLSLWLFIPAACLATLGGATTAHSWARAVGTKGLTAMAQRLRAEKHLTRAAARVQSAGPAGIAVCRLLPGFRVYTSMVAGAVGIDIRTFLLGATPATILWVVAFTMLGVLVGVPAEHALTRVQRAAGEGIILAAAGAAAYLGIRHIPASERHDNPLQTAARPVRLLIAICLDAAIVATVVSGLAELSEQITGIPQIDGLVDIFIVGAAFLLFYLVAMRRGTGGTAGESLLGVSYRSETARS